MFQELMLAVVVSIDIFLSSSACCARGIRIPPLSAAVIALICASVMWLSVTVSGLICGAVTDIQCEILSCTVLAVLGISNIAKSLRSSGTSPEPDTKAKSLSVPEAAAMALAGSFDCAAAGLSAPGEVSSLCAFLCTLAVGLTALTLGTFAGRKISSRFHDLSWSGGLILILFALYNALTLARG